MIINNDVNRVNNGLIYYTKEAIRKVEYPKEIKKIFEDYYLFFNNNKGSFKKFDINWSYELDVIPREKLTLNIEKTNNYDGRVISVHRYETTCIDNQFILKDYFFVGGNKPENIESIYISINGVEIIQEYTNEPMENIKPNVIKDISIIKEIDFINYDSIVLQNALKKNLNYSFILPQKNYLSFGFSQDSEGFDYYISVVVNNSKIFLDVIDNHATIKGFSYIDRTTLNIEDFIEKNRSSAEIIYLFNIINKLQNHGVIFDFQDNNTDSIIDTKAVTLKK